MTKFLLENTSVLRLIKKTLKETPEGYLLFEQDGEWKKLFFKNGKVISASSSSQEDCLGQYLISYGVINTDQFEEAYKTESETRTSMEAVLKFATPKILKQLVFEKIIDSLFIAARWPKCEYSVVSEMQSQYENVDVEVSPKDISKGLKKRITEFRDILSVIPKLGARPKIDHDKAKDTKINNQKEIILNYVLSGKTITEILSIMVPHNYLLLKSFFQLSRMEIISKGTGAPLSRETVIRLVNDSSRRKKSARLVSSFVIAPMNEKVRPEVEGDRFKQEISIFQKLYNEDPENSIYSHCFVKAKSCFIVDFYNNKLSPFAVIEVVDNIDKIADIKEIDNEIVEVIKKEGGRFSIRNIVKLLEDLHEIDVLTSINKLLTHKVIKEIEPQTLIDAIRLGRNEHFDDLLKKEEINKFLEMDISMNLTSSMLSVISGDYSEDIAEEVGLEASGTGTMSLHNYEMTFLMLASMLGNYEAAEFLLMNHANTDLHNGNGVTPLMLALENSHDDIAMLLLDNGAGVDAKNSNGYSALMIAAAKGMAHIVDYMIRLNVDVNQMTSNGQTALHSALRFDNEEIVVSLIAAGIDLNTKDKEGHFPLYYAESVEVIELIKKGAGNSKRIKKKLNKKRNDMLAFDRNILSNKNESVPGTFAVFLFATLLVAASFVNVYLFFFSQDRYGLSSEAENAMERLGKEYCNKFKACKKDLPKHVVAQCEQMGIDIVSAYFRNAQSCDVKMMKECGSCLKSLKCDDFYDVDDSNLSEYCHECLNVCKYHKD